MTPTTWAAARVLRDRDAGLNLAGVVVSSLPVLLPPVGAACVLTAAGLLRRR